MKTRPDPSVSAFWESPFPLSISVSNDRYSQSNETEHREAPVRDGGIAEAKSNRERFFLPCKQALQKIMILIRLDADALSTDKIRELSTELKNIRFALNVFQSRTEKRKARKHFKPFRTLLKLTKALHAVQVESEIIGHHFQNDFKSNSYLYQLYQKKHHKLQRLTRYLTRKKSRKLSEQGKKLSRDLKAITTKALNRYLQKRKNQLEQMLNQDIFKERRLTGLRKKLDAWCSNAEFLGNGVVPDQWCEVLRCLDEWQNLQMAIDHSGKAIYAGNLNAYEAEPLGKLRQQLLNDKARLYEKIVTTASGCR